MPEHHFDERDKSRLEEAAGLISDVLDGNPTELTMTVISFLANAVNEVRLAEKYMGVST